MYHSGKEILRETVNPNACVVILTSCRGEDDICRNLPAGARTYFVKDAGVEQLIEYIKNLATENRFLPTEAASTLTGHVQVDRLSKRELEILVHLATGKSNKLIARSAGIEVGTVKFHVNNILSKLHVSSRTEAAIVAVRRGLLSVF